MPSFKDNRGRDWLVEVNVFALKRVEKTLKVNLYAEAFSGMQKVYADPVLLVDVLYVLCKEQADAARPKVTDEDFGRAMSGDAVWHAADALTEALADFFPPRQREVFLKEKAMREQIHEKAAERLDQDIQDLEQMSFDDLLRRLKERSGGQPGSAGSTPAPSP